MTATPSTSAPAPDHHTLLACLEAEITLLSDFVGALQKEADVLSAGAELSALETVTNEKNRFAEKLDQHSAQRNTLLDAMGYAPDRSGLVAAAAAHPLLADAVQQVLDTTRQASLLNTGNGQIIERFLKHHGQALDVLHHLTGRSQLYDARGRTRPTAAPRTGHSKSA